MPTTSVRRRISYQPTTRPTSAAAAAAPTHSDQHPTDEHPPPAGSVPQPPPEASKPERTEEWTGGPVEFDRVVPPSGNLGVASKQFWLGPERAGAAVTFWADEQLIHLLIAGARVKTLHSHLSSTDLPALAGNGGRPAGPSPIPPPEPDGTALEVNRTISGAGLVSLGPATVLPAEALGGRGVSIRIDR